MAKQLRPSVLGSAALIQLANTGSHPAGSNMAQAPGQGECLYRPAETLHPFIYVPCLPILGQNCNFFWGNLMNTQGGNRHLCLSSTWELRLDYFGGYRSQIVRAPVQLTRNTHTLTHSDAFSLCAFAKWLFIDSID